MVSEGLPESPLGWGLLVTALVIVALYATFTIRERRNDR